MELGKGKTGCPDCERITGFRGVPHSPCMNLASKGMVERSMQRRSTSRIATSIQTLLRESDPRSRREDSLPSVPQSAGHFRRFFGRIRLPTCVLPDWNTISKVGPKNVLQGILRSIDKSIDMKIGGNRRRNRIDRGIDAFN